MPAGRVGAEDGPQVSAARQAPRRAQEGNHGMSETQIETRPPIPASLAARPVRGALAQPWVNVQLADGGTGFRSTHRPRAEQAWKDCLGPSCGHRAAPNAA